MMPCPQMHELSWILGSTGWLWIPQANRWLALQRSAVTHTAAGGYPRPAQANQEGHREHAGVLTYYSILGPHPRTQDHAWHDQRDQEVDQRMRQHLIYHHVVVQGGDGLGVVVRRTIYVWTPGCS